MVCDMCRIQSETEKYDIHGIVIELCSECFTELQKEVIYIEGLSRDYYIQVFLKLGIQPKLRCNHCNTLIPHDDEYIVNNRTLCEDCFFELNDFFKGG